MGGGEERETEKVRVTSFFIKQDAFSPEMLTPGEMKAGFGAGNASHPLRHGVNFTTEDIHGSALG